MEEWPNASLRVLTIFLVFLMLPFCLIIGMVPVHVHDSRAKYGMIPSGAESSVTGRIRCSFRVRRDLWVNVQNGAMCKWCALCSLLRRTWRWGKRADVMPAATRTPGALLARCDRL